MPGLTGWTLTNHVRLALDLAGLALALIAAGLLLWWRETNAGVPRAALVLPASQALLFSVSAIYHGIHWSPEAKARWQRADHSVIYIKVAGTATALAAVVDVDGWSELVIAGVWAVTLPGVAQKIWWPGVPVTWSMPVQFAQALLALPILQAFSARYPGMPQTWLAAALVFYLIGFAVFASERPRFWPGQFCYHDFFHVMLICAALSLYAALAQGLGLA